MATFIQEKMPQMMPNDVEGSLKKLHKYIESQTEQLSYIFGNLGGDNFNTQDMNNFVANLGATNIITQTIVSNSVVTKSLYAERGDIAQLTVDWLSTSKKVMKYLNRDTSDDDYIEIHEQGIELKSATVVMSGGEPLAETLLDRNENQLFWQKDVTYAEIIDGFPYVNGKQVYMDTEETDYPVRVYKYNTTTKMLINFEQVNGVNVPKITMGNVVITDSDVTVRGASLSNIEERLIQAEEAIAAIDADLSDDVQAAAQSAKDAEFSMNATEIKRMQAEYSAKVAHHGQSEGASFSLQSPRANVTTVATLSNPLEAGRQYRIHTYWSTMDYSHYVDVTYINGSFGYSDGYIASEVWCNNGVTIYCVSDTEIRVEFSKSGVLVEFAPVDDSVFDAPTDSVAQLEAAVADLIERVTALETQT